MGRSTVTSTKEMDEAIEFAESLRGNYIIGQALFYAIKELEKIPSPYREVSNISDMKYIRDNLYMFPDELYETVKIPEKGQMIGEIM